MAQAAKFGGIAAVVLTAIVLGELPPLRALAAWIDAHRAVLLLGGAVVAALGLALFLGGVLKLIMDRGDALSRGEAEDVERSVRMAARPVAWRASGYRVLGTAVGRGATESFSLRDLKTAWRSGAIRTDRDWQRRSVTTAGVLLLLAGVCGVIVAGGPPWIKVLIGGVCLYAFGAFTWAMWRS